MNKKGQSAFQFGKQFLKMPLFLFVFLVTVGITLTLTSTTFGNPDPDVGSYGSVSTLSALVQCGTDNGAYRIEQLRECFQNSKHFAAAFVLNGKEYTSQDYLYTSKPYCDKSKKFTCGKEIFSDKKGNVLLVDWVMRNG